MTMRAALREGRSPMDKIERLGKAIHTATIGQEHSVANPADFDNLRNLMRNADAEFVRSCTLSGLPIMPGPVRRPTMIVPQEMYDRVKGMIPPLRSGASDD